MAYVNKSDIYKLFDESNGVIKLHIADVDMLPTVYVEEVVRCKHCKYYKASQCHRFSGKMIITPYFYCAYGEKENGQ